MIERKLHTLTLQGKRYMEVNDFTEPFFDLAFKKSRELEMAAEDSNYMPGDTFFLPVERMIEKYCDQTGCDREDAIKDFCEKGVVYKWTKNWINKSF